MDQKVLRLIRSNPLIMNNEKRLQEEIGSLFDANGILHKREVSLGDGDIIDFMLPDGLGIEVKIKESKRAIYRQCVRYCGHAQVRTLILITATAMGFPEEIEGKPCYVASLGAGWL